MLLLQVVGGGAQGTVQLGYDTTTKKHLAIKRVYHQNDYDYEKSVYNYLQQHHLSHLSTKLLGCDDESRTLLLERGQCDLAKFVELRRQCGDPLDTNELFLITQYVGDCMLKLSTIGV